MKISQILDEIHKLSQEERRIVLQELLNSLQKDKPQRKITELAGLGKDIWKGLDVEDYIRNERNWD
ncbi:MAG: hypothetical protein KF803_05910 [Cyclobacteriaceae bacterium]|nr:hypothetical protein [Cyclobacteriaceae bacterium]